MASVAVLLTWLAATPTASSVLNLNGTSHYTPDQVVVALYTDVSVKKLTPFTYLEFSGPTVSESDSSSVVARFLSLDDVFSEAYLATVLISGADEAPLVLEEDAEAYLDGSDILSAQLNGTIPPGLYFLHPDGTIT